MAPILEGGPGGTGSYGGIEIVKRPSPCVRGRLHRLGWLTQLVSPACRKSIGWAGGE